MKEFEDYIFHIGQAIRFYRGCLNMSQEELAHLSGVSCRQIQRIENAKGSSSLQTYYKLAQALKIDIVNIFTFENSVIEATRHPSRASLNIQAESINKAGVWDWNIETDEITWSDQIYQIFGEEPQSFKASYPAFLKKVDPRDRKLVESEVDKAIKFQNYRYQVKHRVLNNTDQENWVLETGTIYRDLAGEPVRMIGIIQEITSPR